MKYCDGLPRKVVKGKQCQILLEDGTRCKKVAKYEIHRHFDPETTGLNDPWWTSLYVCENCLDWNNRRKLNEKGRSGG